MGINLSILYYDLEKYHPKKGELGSATSTSLRYISFWRPGDILANESLYILDAGNIGELCLEPGISLLCLGEPDLTGLPDGCGIIWVPENTDVKSLFSELSKLFFRYQQWEMELYQAVSQQRSMAVLRKLSLDIFREPLSLFACNFLTIFSVYHEKYGKMPRDFSLFKEKEYLSADVMSSIEKSDNLKEALKKKIPYIYQDEGEKRTLCCNIWVNGKNMATLHMDEINHRACERDAALLYILSQHIEEAFAGGYALSELKKTEMQVYIQNVLEGKVPSYEQKIRALESMGWNVEDQYVCFLVTASQKIPDQAFYLHGGALAQHLGNTVFVIWEQKIILVCNVTRMASSGYRSELQKLNGQMAEMGVVCGVSNKFDGLEKLPHFVEAAYAACQYGKDERSGAGLYYYEDYMQVFYTAKALENTVPDIYIPSELIQVLDYDRERQSDYQKVLRGLLQNNMSATDTAKKLYMHRNTVIHRAERLKDYFGMDLDSYEYRVKLIHAFEVMDFMAVVKR